jgi:hypothetical protein
VEKVYLINLFGYSKINNSFILIKKHKPLKIYCTMNTKILLSIAAASTVFFSCNKKAETQAINEKQNTALALITTVVNDKYTFMETDNANINLDAYFETTANANNLEADFEATKKAMAVTSAAYTAHSSKISIKEVVKNADGTETITANELSNLTTNQKDASTNAFIQTTALQQYVFVVKFDGSIYKIVSVRDIDKEILQHEKEEANNMPYVTDDLEEIETIDKRLSGIATVNYNRAAAIAYAATYAITPNVAYQDFTSGCSYCGGDCTNFLSQCMLAGGWGQQFYKASSTSAWWYGKSTNPAGYKGGFSGIWPSAQKMGFFLKKLTSRVTRVTSLSQINPGDPVMMVAPNGNAYHALIVTQKATNGDLYLSCHTSNRHNNHMSNYGITATTKFSGITPDIFLFKMKDKY